MATDFSDSLQDAVEELSHRAQERSANCVDLSELSEVVEEHGLSDDEGQAFQETLEQRGLEVRDDCGRERVEDTRYINGEMAERTTDAMSLFLREAARHPRADPQQRGPQRPARAQTRPRTARAPSTPGAAANRGGDRGRGEALRTRGARGARGSAGGHEPRSAGGRGGGHLARRADPER